MAANELSASPLRIRFRVRFRDAIRVPGTPVFLYHDVSPCPASEDRYAVNEANFREHLSFLRAQGFAVADLPALMETATGRRAIITFDDGLGSHYGCVFPALLDHGFTATFFVSTALIDSPGYVSWSQLREMSSAGMTIGSHGREHVDYSALGSTLATRELAQSRMALEDALGKPAATFSAPYGFLNRSLIESARQAGFSWICSSHPWLASAASAPLGRPISRLAIYKNTDLRAFSELANGSALPLLARRARNAVLYLPKQFLLRTSPQRLGVRVHQEAE
jgi:peptidoglycan/xylan/chitin deacetylase (PgdA/CDA1 family)